jgi:hypothetical protein
VGAVIEGSGAAVDASRLADVLGEALGLLETAVRLEDRREILQGMEPSLLQQCLDMCADHAAAAIEPVRVVHHFACTGGTLVSRCIAALPNVQLLSEIDPLSTMPLGGTTHPFMPTDVIGLARRSTRGVDEALLAQMFRAALEVLHADTVRRGCRLVLRDHAHSHFCLAGQIPDRPTLRAIVSAGLPVCSLVTVRHPVDSFVSLQRNGWIAFAPSTIDEYARRYVAFLDRHHGVPVVRYEDLVAEPVAAMSRICDALQLALREDFADYQDLFMLSGSSGRQGDRIAPRPRGPEVEQWLAAARDSERARELCRRLGYEL